MVPTTIAHASALAGPGCGWFVRFTVLLPPASLSRGELWSGHQLWEIFDRVSELAARRGAAIRAAVIIHGLLVCRPKPHEPHTLKAPRRHSNRRPALSHVLPGLR